MFAILPLSIDFLFIFEEFLAASMRIILYLCNVKYLIQTAVTIVHSHYPFTQLLSRHWWDDDGGAEFYASWWSACRW